MYSYIQFRLHMNVAFGASGISLIGAFGARWQLKVVFMGAVAGNRILHSDLWPGRAKIPLFPLKLLVHDPLVGSYPAPHWTFKKEINMHVLVIVWLDIDNDVKFVNSVLANVPIAVLKMCSFRTPSCECSRKRSMHTDYSPMPASGPLREWNLIR